MSKLLGQGFDILCFDVDLKFVIWILKFTEHVFKET